MLNPSTNTTASGAANDTAFGVPVHYSFFDTSEPSGESTPTAFAPTHPTQEDPLWHPLLEYSLKRFISTVRETSSRAQSTTSLPHDTTEKQPMCIVQGIKGSHPTNSNRPANRDHHHPLMSDETVVLTTQLQQSPLNIFRGTDSHNTSGTQDPTGDTEMPAPPLFTGTIANEARGTLIDKNTRHPDRQSPPPRSQSWFVRTFRLMRTRQGRNASR